jgi:catechol 2,3-dioxygenase-like lactoylglutathione lyase family enzyme
MDNLNGRSVFFVEDAESSLGFYTKRLGFALDWTHQEQGRVFVFQVSLFGFQLILNQTEEWTKGRSGHGRVFIGIDEPQMDAFRRHIGHLRIETTVLHWGAPTLVVHDLDQNEMFFWLPASEQEMLKERLASADISV